ncbi:HMG (high mobility group) box domain-containing protein [Moniliophthora roreri]|nr:HMG (high mobility group) box domain-containing protein [Moniliophthora roreri]
MHSSSSSVGYNSVTATATPSTLSAALDPSLPSPPSPLSVDLASFPSPDSTIFSSVGLSPSSPSSCSNLTRRRNPSRIPRPRNAFMIFRSHSLSQRSLLPKSVEHDQSHISRIIGHLWKALPEAQKDLYRSQADREKIEHMKKYPNYRFEPNMTKVKLRRKVKRNGEGDLERCKKVAEFLMAGKRGEELNRAVNELPNVQVQVVPPSITQPRKRTHKRVAKQDTLSSPSSPPPSSSVSSSFSPYSSSSISTPATSPSPMLCGWSPLSGEAEQVEVGPAFLNSLLPPQQPDPNANITATPLMNSLQPPLPNSLLWQQSLHGGSFYPSTLLTPTIHDQSPTLFRNDAVHESMDFSNKYEPSPNPTHFSPSYPDTPSLPMYNNVQNPYPHVVGDVQTPIMFFFDPVGWNKMTTVNPQMLDLRMGNMNLDMDNAHLPVA